MAAVPQEPVQQAAAPQVFHQMQAPAQYYNIATNASANPVTYSLPANYTAAPASVTAPTITYAQPQVQTAPMTYSAAPQVTYSQPVTYAAPTQTYVAPTQTYAAPTQYTHGTAPASYTMPAASTTRVVVVKSAQQPAQQSGTFEMLDQNGDGVVTREEFQQGFVGEPATTQATPTIQSATNARVSSVGTPVPAPTIQAAAPIMSVGAPQAASGNFMASPMAQPQMIPVAAGVPSGNNIMSAGQQQFPFVPSAKLEGGTQQAESFVATSAQMQAAVNGNEGAAAAAVVLPAAGVAPAAAKTSSKTSKKDKKSLGKKKAKKACFCC